MYNDNDRAKLFTRRALLLGGGQVALVGTLVARMYYLQVVEAAKYRLQSDSNRISTQLLAPPRGLIFDRNGTALAVNRHNYRVLLIPEQAPSIDYALDQLSHVILLTDADRERVHRDARRHRPFVPITVRDNLSWEDVARIEVNSLDLPGVTIDVGQSRYYPLGKLGGHILGYVAAPTAADLRAEPNDPLLELPGFRIGVAGVEKVYDLALRGKGGKKEVEVNALGRVVRELDRQDGIPGINLNLTLDMRLQEYAAQRLAGQSAAAVVMDIHSGDVIVMASTPSFDPNDFNRGLTNAEWKNLTDDPLAPLIDKAIAGQFAPGSTFKLNTALAGLESGAITPQTKFFCPGYMQLGNMVFHCWKRGGHGLIDMPSAIQQSCDVYFYHTAQRTGIDRIHDMGMRLGLDHPTGIDLPNEMPGLVPTRAWKRRTLHQPWHPGETLIAGIGQGYILVTPLQLAVMVSRIANGGFAVKPHLARDLIKGATVSPRPPPDWPSCNIADDHLAAVRKGMYEVVNKPGGTAYYERILDPSMAMCGKTGTAQVRRITRRERELGLTSDADFPWKYRDNALFVAYAPADAPRFAAVVVVQHGGEGASASAPVVRDLLIEVQKRAQALAEGERRTQTWTG